MNMFPPKPCLEKASTDMVPTGALEKESDLSTCSFSV